MPWPRGGRMVPVDRERPARVAQVSLSASGAHGMTVSAPTVARAPAPGRGSVSERIVVHRSSDVGSSHACAAAASSTLAAAVRHTVGCPINNTWSRFPSLTPGRSDQSPVSAAGRPKGGLSEGCEGAALGKGGPRSRRNARVLVAPDAVSLACAAGISAARERRGDGSVAVSAKCSFRCHLATSGGWVDSFGMPLRTASSGCLDAVLEVKLGEDAGDVVADGVRAQREVSCDLVVALAAGESLEDLELAVGQGCADGARGDGAGLARDVSRECAAEAFPAIFEDSTDSPAAVALTALMIASTGALLRM